MPDTILRAEDLHKSYGDTLAVQGITLEVKRGEVLGLLGPNGAGKTTTISMLTGLISPTSGAITLDGEVLRPGARAVKSKIGLVPQEIALYPTLSGRSNLRFFGRVYGLRGSQLNSRVKEVLQMVGLADRAEEAVSTYSGGMKRRINIGAGLLHKPAILFLDEPTVGVDPQSRNAIFEGVEALNRAGTTIVYTTHYMEEAERLCHRVAIVDQGRVVALDTPPALIARLGGGVILLGLGDDQGGEMDRRARDLTTVKSIGRREGKLVVETRNLQDALVGILAITAELSVSITSLELLEPNLESVFLQLTGKKLRE